MGIIGTFLKLLGVIFLILIIINCIILAKTGKSPIQISIKSDTETNEGGEEEVEAEGDTLLQFMNKFKRNVYITSQ